MSVSDADLELLETYLDGELPRAEGDALIDRLRTEPALAAAIETLKSERATRAIVWQSYEPSQASVDQLIDRVERKVDNHWQWARRLSRLRVVSGAAACIVVGVLMGYLGRGQNQPGAAPVQGTMVANNAGPAVGGPVVVPIYDEYGNPVAYQQFDSAAEANSFVEEMRQFEERRIHNQNIVPVNAPQKF